MLRKLKIEDAPRMYEWMHDEAVIEGLQAEVFREKTIDDCVAFIQSTVNDVHNCHMAIVDEKDVYQGTVSLKHISVEHKDAEFAIVLRKDAMGKGMAKLAIKDIMQIAFDELNLDAVYCNALMGNSRAIALYEKMGYIKMKIVPERIMKLAPLGKDVIFFVYKRSNKDEE